MDQPPFGIVDDVRSREDWFSAVYQAVDAALDREGNVPPGTLAALYRAVDGLRCTHAPDRHVARAGVMVVTLHRLQTMLRLREPSLAVAGLRRDLAMMQREWLETAPICH